jgi:hypothetical protein
MNEIGSAINIIVYFPRHPIYADTERSFSAVRRLKTWIGTTMTETRLNAVQQFGISIVADRIKLTKKATVT